VINAILLIGVMGMILDQIMARLQRYVGYAE
jgi:ABC-type nitrate/sulfonate/bicarbonate transport system permease component